MNERLKRLRQFLGLSQKEFSQKINVGYSTLAMFETGQRKMKDIHIAQICYEFNVNEHWLRTGEGEMLNDESSKNFNEFVSILNHLSPELQNYILDQAKALLELQKKKKI